MLIDRTGTFRGLPVSTGIATSSGGYPQFVAKFDALEYWDEDEKAWLDWSGYEEREITGYFILFGKSGDPTRTCSQLQKALGWDGRDFDVLNNSDYSEVSVQFRVEENTYNGNTRLQVAWIDHADASPGRTVEKLKAGDLKKLNAKYAAGLKKLGGGPTISKPATDKPKAAPKASAEIGPKKGAAKPKARATAAPPATPPPAEVEPTPEPDVTSGEIITKEEAWDGVIAGAHESITDERISELWVGTVTDLGGEDSLDPEDWARVRGIVLAQVGGPEDS